ncbi:MAG: DUF86 domain-containing protein [Xanthobacteraceae bacterium]
MPRSTRVWLIDIRTEIAGIRDLTKSATQAEFAASWAMRRAAEHALLIISEAAKNLPEEIKAQRPEIAWNKIHGLGNMLRHEYRHIDSEILWSIIVDYLDSLDTAAAALLDGLEKA